MRGKCNNPNCPREATEAFTIAMRDFLFSTCKECADSQDVIAAFSKWQGGTLLKEAFKDSS